MKNPPRILAIFLLLNSMLLCSFAQNEDPYGGLNPTPSAEFLVELKQTYNLQNPQNPQPGLKSTVSSEAISRGLDNTVYFSSPDSPIRIQKVFSPPNKTNYLLGDPIGVYVEVSSIDKDLSDIHILEIIDDDFCVLNISDEYCKISDLDTICKYHKELNRDSYLESDNCINKNSRCGISPKKTGIVLNKDTDEYNLFDFNLSDFSNDSQYDGLRTILNKNFNIRWANSGSLDREIKNISTISIKRLNDIDFIKLVIDNENGSAKLNINNERDYVFKAKKEGKLIRINDTEVALNFSFNNLTKKEIFTYKYYIKPKRSGIFNTITLVRSWGRSDIESTSLIDVKDPNPIFDINPRPKDDSVVIRQWGLCNEPLEIVYDITYLGGAFDPEMHNTKLKLENDLDYYDGFFDAKDKSPFKIMNFTKYKTEHIHSNIQFKDNGKIQVPGIYINDKLYNFKDMTITVTDIPRWIASIIIARYSPIFAFFVGLFTFLILVFYEESLEEFFKNRRSKK